MPLEFQTYSIVAGTTYCNASCFFCISKMTTPEGVADELDDAAGEVNWHNFHKATRLAQQSGVTTVLLTGKGEPTLYPRQITAYLEKLEPYGFPLIELQTNGISLCSKRFRADDTLARWHRLGLNTVILSVVHTDDERNRQIYMPRHDRYPPLTDTIQVLHESGFTVRLGLIMLDGFIDSPAEIDRLVEFCRAHSVEQLTVRPVTMAEMSQDPATKERTRAVALDSAQVDAIREHVEQRGTLLMKLVHGARVFDVGGQNLCLTNCLTINPDEEELRSLIFLSTGELIYDWQYPGAVLLGPGSLREGVRR